MYVERGTRRGFPPVKKIKRHRNKMSSGHRQVKARYHGAGKGKILWGRKMHFLLSFEAEKYKVNNDDSSQFFDRNISYLCVAILIGKQKSKAHQL